MRHQSLHLLLKLRAWSWGLSLGLGRRWQGFLGLGLSLGLGLGGCAGTAKLLDFPFDTGGRSLNSPGAEIQPRLVDRYLVFVSDRRGSQDIFLFDAAARQLIDLPGLNSLDTLASHPAISENGNYIVYQATRQGKSSIYLYDRQLFQVRNLTENLGVHVRHPTISANGEVIAFEAAINGAWHVSLVDRSGKPLDLPTLPR